MFLRYLTVIVTSLGIALGLTWLGMSASGSSLAPRHPVPGPTPVPELLPWPTPDPGVRPKTPIEIFYYPGAHR